MMFFHNRTVVKETYIIVSVFSTVLILFKCHKTN